ncbi:MAG: AAA family ATPase [Bacteroidales bacterium]|nr:AAA family ATPase [Bacteroidales bacterium]
MNTTLEIGQQVYDFEVEKFIESSDYNNTESYLVFNKDGNKGILKLYKNNNDNEIPFEKQVCSMIEEGMPLPQLLDSGIISINKKKYHYTIVEYINGKWLYEFIMREKYNTWEEAVVIIVEVLKALKHLHSIGDGIIYNNINTTTIEIQEQNESTKVYLTNTEYLSHRINGKTPFDVNKLNNWFRAPETFKGMYDEQTDIFSVGALLYTMIEGKEPWNIDKLYFCRRISKPELKRLRMEKNDVVKDMQLSEAQKKILNKMLALDYDNRYKNVDEVLNDIQNGCVMTKENKPSKTTKEKKKKNSKSDEKHNENVKTEVKHKGRGFDDVAGLNDVKQMLYKNIMFVMQNKEKAIKYKLKLPNGVLFYGPPGCGKTFMAEKFAEESKLNFIMIKGSDIGSMYIHGTQGKIAEVFEKAAENAPTVICFDELEGMVPDRSKMISEHYGNEVNEFLSQLNNCSERGIFVIGTTNRPEKIDPAILRTGRIDKMIYIPLPDMEARKELFKIHLKGRYYNDSIDFDELATKSEGYVASDICYMVNSAALEAAIADVPISQDLMLKNIRETRYSLSNDEIANYECMQKKIEQKNYRNERRRIGFIK